MAEFFGHGCAQFPGRLIKRLKTRKDDKIFREKTCALIVAGSKLSPRKQPVFSPES